MNLASAFAFFDKLLCWTWKSLDASVGFPKTIESIEQTLLDALKWQAHKWAIDLSFLICVCLRKKINGELIDLFERKYDFDLFRPVHADQPKGSASKVHFKPPKPLASFDELWSESQIGIKTVST